MQSIIRVSVPRRVAAAKEVKGAGENWAQLDLQEQKLAKRQIELDPEWEQR